MLSWTAMNWRRNPYENTWECVNGGYTLKEGTLVCLVLHRVAVQELCAHASLARKVVPCNNEGWHSCLESDT